MKRKSRSVWGIVCLVLLMIPMLGAVKTQTYASDNNFWYHSEREGEWYYDVLEDGTASISYYSAEDWSEEELLIPDEIAGYPVTEIRYIGYNLDLKTITIPDSVRSIPENAFKNCYRLETINISPYHETLAVVDNVLFSKRDKRLICYPPGLDAESYEILSGIRIIGDEAFYDCRANTIVIPDSVTEIGTNPFLGSWSLKMLQLDEGQTSYVYEDGFLWEAATGRLVSYIHERRYQDTSVVIPDEITKIGDYAFAECNKITDVTIPDTVTEIGNYAFQNCEMMESIVIPADVTSIGDGAFMDCESLVEVKLPDVLDYWGDECFEGCAALKEIVIPANIIVTPYNCFSDCSSLEKVTLPEDLEEIYIGTFSGCTSLTQVKIPEPVKTIGMSAFYKCTSLDTVNLPEGLEEIGVWAFSGCTSLESITFPKQWFDVYKGSFSDCDNLVVTVQSATGVQIAEFCELPYVYAEQGSLDWLTSGGPDDPEDLGMWVIRNYTNTGEPYLSHEYWLNGTYKNGKSKNGSMQASVNIDRNYASLSLRDRDSEEALFSWLEVSEDGQVITDTVYDVCVTDESGNNYHISGWVNFQGSVSVTEEVAFETLIDVLKENQRLSFHITNNFNDAEYDFTITDSSYFDHAWDAFWSELEEGGWLEAAEEVEETIEEAEETIEEAEEVVEEVAVEEIEEVEEIEVAEETVEEAE